MGRMYEDKLVCCPYFIKQDSTRLHCEGWNDRYRTTTITAFDSASARRNHADTYCNSQRWDHCPLCRLIASKYSD